VRLRILEDDDGHENEDDFSTLEFRFNKRMTLCTFILAVQLSCGAKILKIVLVLVLELLLDC